MVYVSGSCIVNCFDSFTSIRLYTWQNQSIQVSNKNTEVLSWGGVLIPEKANRETEPTETHRKTHRETHGKETRGGYFCGVVTQISDKINLQEKRDVLSQFQRAKPSLDYLGARPQRQE